MAQTQSRHLAYGCGTVRSRRTTSCPPANLEPRGYRLITAGARFSAPVTIVLSLLLSACGGGDASRATSSTPIPYPLAKAAVVEPRKEAAGLNGVLATKESGPVSASDLLISAQPRDVVTAAGQAASFSVTASGGAGPLQYQWQMDGVDIAGARASTYTTQVLSLRDSDAVYAVVVSHGGQRVTSIGARLTVNPGVATAVMTAPSITSQPRARTALVGQTATFFVRAETSGTPAYQWQRNRIPIPGATGASYTTGPMGLADNGSRFNVVLRSGSASTTSADALLTVTSAPTASGN